MDDQQPLLENNAGFRNGKRGFPTSTIATLYGNRIEVIDKNGDLLAKVPLSQIVQVRFSSSHVRLKLANGRYFSLDFQPHAIARRAAFGAFGALGAVLGYYTGQGRQIAQIWINHLQQNGVRFK